VLGTIAAFLGFPLGKIFSTYIMYIISGASFHLIAISFFVYLFVNLFENLIHYNIGRFTDKETKFEVPTKKDWIKIAIVMCVFALLQGLLTYWFNRKLKY
jgi:uncharacterized membrane protein YhfC